MFYTDKLGFQIVWEADWFLLLSTPNEMDTISFLAPNHPTQTIKNFQEPYSKTRVYLTIEVGNVDEYYKEVKANKIPIALELQNEEWGDRHFAIIDPNNIGIDFVTHKKQE